MRTSTRLLSGLSLVAGLAMTWLLAGLGGSPAWAEEKDNEIREDDAIGSDSEELAGEPDEEHDEGTSDEEVTYACPTCGYTSDEAGNCPGCNIALVEVKAKGGARVSTKNGLEAGSGDNQATIDPSGNIDARSGGSSAGVSADGSVRANDGKGNPVDVNSGKGVTVKSGNLELSIPTTGGGY